MTKLYNLRRSAANDLFYGVVLKKNSHKLEQKVA